MFENLERRQLLSTYYVNDNWVVTTDNNAPGLDATDEVANTGFGDNGSFTGLIFGTDAFSTINDALGVATNPGDIIRVISGTYSGTTTVTGANAGVLLQGDNFGTAGTAVRVTETILNGSSGSLVINAANVQVDGFTIRDAAVGAGTGITVGAVAGVQIKNNIITDNSVGVEFGAGSSNFTVDRNKVDANNRAGANRGQGVRVLANTGSGTITNNSFTGHGSFSSTGAVSLVGSSSVAVGTVGNGNTFGTNAVAVRTYAGTTGTTLVGNTFAATNTTYINHAGATELNASANTFDGVSPSGNNNIVQQNAIVDKIIDGVDVSGRGLVRINAGQVYVTANSFNAGLGTTTPDIQRAVDVSVASDTVHIQGATYTGNVNTSTKTVTLTPTPGTTQVTINGSVVFDSSDTLLLEINGLVAGTGYDQLIVNGTVTLGGVNLATTGSTVVAAPGNQITLIDNNMADAVVGSFNGLLNGANVTVAGQPFVVFYNGGTGNDVVLVRVPAAAPPAVVYVDDSWVSAVSGVDQDGVGGGSAFGFDQFADIQSAIDAVAAGGTIHVAAGQYIQNVVVDKGVSILGPNSAIAGNGVRVGEAVVRPENSQPDPFTDPVSVVFYITSSGVTIKGLTIDGDNTSINSGVVKGGADIDAVDGIASYEGVGTITIQNNIVRNTAYTGINFDNVENGGAATSGNVISFNLIQNIGDGGTSGAAGISIGSNFYANVLNNQINGAVIGIQTGNFYIANPGATGSISNNVISASRMGIWANAHSLAASTMTVSGNTISAIDDANFNYWTGIMVSAILNAVDVTITNNNINGSATTNESYGYEVWNTPTSAVLSVDGGTVTGVDYGVFVNNFDSFGANAGNTSLKVDSVDITAAIAGVWVLDSALNTNGATVDVTVTGGTELQSGGVGIGLLVEGADSTVTVESSDIHDNSVGVQIQDDAVATISGNQIYNNDTGLYIDSAATGSLIEENLFSANAAEDIYVDTSTTATSVNVSGNSLESTVAITNGSAASIQASGNWWGVTTNPFTAGKITGSGAALVDYSPWMFTSVDLDSDPSNGFQPLYDVLGVDDDSPQSSYLSAGPTHIAEAIATIEDGGQLVIYAGTYTEDVDTSSKSLAISIDDSTAVVTIDGDLTLDNDDVLLIDVGGTTPGTLHDQIVVTGTATLGDATLLTTIGYVPGPTDEVTIIDANVLAGDFDSLPQGAPVGSGFRINYDASVDDVILVQNTPAPVADADGPYAIDEGDSVTLDGTGSFDPDAFLGDVITNWDWDLNGDNIYGDVTGANPTVSWATLQSFGIDDDDDYTIRLRVTNNQAETAIDTTTISVANVEPTIGITGASSSNEGSTYSLTLGAVVDPGADTISSYRINWGDGSPATVLTPAQLLLAGGVVTHVYVDDNPTNTPSDNYSISVDLQDEDNTPSYYIDVVGQTVTVNNVAPAPVINGAPPQAVVNVPITVTGTANDPGAADTFTYAWSVVKSGFGLFASQTGASSTFSFTPDDDATYTISLTVTDDDTGAGNATNVNVVAFESFKVIDFDFNGSGFSVQFNRPADLDVLNLYDGVDAPVDAADVIVTGLLNPGSPIRGSLVWDAATNTAHWVATGGVLAADTYTVTLVSGASAWTADSGPNPVLDGDGNGTAGDNYTDGFVIAPATSRVVSVQDFARGPSQNVVLPLGNTVGAGLPVRIDNALNVTSVDFSIRYNPNILDITAVTKAAGVPADWSLISNVGAPTVISATEWQINVTVFTTLNTVLSASAVSAAVVQFTASVDAAAVYGSSALVEIDNVDVAISNVSEPGRGDTAVHKIIYIGDADGDTIYTGSDAGMIAGVVVGPHNGFDIYDLTDPRIIADVDNNGSITGNDASFVAQKSVMAPRPEIPNRPVGVIAPAGGIDPTIDIPDNIPGVLGTTVLVPVNITDSAAGLIGFNVDVTYDKNKLSLADGLGSPDVTLGDLFDDGGWTLIANVDQANGIVRMSFFRADPFVGGTGTVANLSMDVANAAPLGATAVTATGFASQGGFSFTYMAGSVLIQADTTGPAAPTTSFNFDGGVPMNVTFTWSENVAGPKTLTLTNLTTNTVVPVTLVYNPNTGTYTFPSFAAGVLPNGNYQGVINAADVTDQIGNPMAANAVINFFVLAGDANRDRLVNIQDLVILSNNWMQAGTYTDGDFNYDGIVDHADLGILSLNWQQTVAPPLAPALASPTAPVATSAPAAAQPARTAARKPTRVIDLVQ